MTRMAMVTLVGGAYDGHRQELPVEPRESAGTWMILPGEDPAWDAAPLGSSARAVYEPDPEPAPATVWHYRHVIYI